MLNFLHSKSQFGLNVIVFTMTSAIALVAPVRAENNVINEEQSTYLSPDFDYSSQQLVDLLNSDDIKFNLLEQTYDFTPSVLNTDSINKTNLNTRLEKNSFTQANQYSVQGDFQVSEFKQLGNVDFAFIFDFTQ